MLLNLAQRPAPTTVRRLIYLQHIGEQPGSDENSNSGAPIITDHTSYLDAAGESRNTPWNDPTAAGVWITYVLLCVKQEKSYNTTPIGTSQTFLFKT